MHQAGITNAVATLGTALTSDHLAIIRRFATKVVLLFDPDAAGIRASLRSLDLFVDSGLGVTVISLPDGQDPDAFVRHHGPESFMRLHEQAPSLVEFAVEHSLRSGASRSIDDRIRSVDEILRILQKTSHRIEKEEYMRVVAERLGISQQRLIERYAEVAPKRPAGTSQSAKGGTSQPARSPTIPEESDLVYLLIQGQSPALRWRPCARTISATWRAGGRRSRFGTWTATVAFCSGRFWMKAWRTLMPWAVTELSMSERHFDDPAAYIAGLSRGPRWSGGRETASSGAVDPGIEHRRART